MGISLNPFGTPQVPDPRKFNSGPQSPLPGGSSSSGSAFTSAQQQQLQNALSAAGIWDTISGLGGDIWDKVKGLLPKDASGNIDWGAIGSDITGWVKNNKDTILQGLSAYNDYSRQQQSDKYAKEALDLAKQRYADAAPLRVAGQAGMLDPSKNTPDISGLRAQSQNGLSVQAPIPVAAPHTNFDAAQQIAGPRSGNPFAKPMTPSGLPVAGPPGTPGTPNGPSPRPIVPTSPRPLPVGTGPTVSVPALPLAGVAFPGATAHPLPVSVASPGGLIKNGPQDRKLPAFTPAPPLPVATPAVPPPGATPQYPFGRVGGF